MKLRILIFMTVIVVLVSGGSPSTFAEKHFDPSVEVSFGYNDNVTNNTKDDPDGQFDDYINIYHLVLQGDVVSKKRKFTYYYRPSLFRYDEIDDLDRDEHRARIGYKSQPTRKLILNFRVNGTQTQIQGDATSVSDPDLFLGRRTDRGIYDGQVSFDLQVSRRWRSSGGIAARFERFEAIPGLEGDLSSQVEDRDSYYANLGFARSLSPVSTLGFEGVHSRFELDISGDSEADALVVTYSRKISRKLDIDMSGGVFDTRGVGGNDIEEETGFQGHLNLTRTFDKVRFKVTFRQDPTGGGGLAGTSINTVLALGLGNVGAGSWRWQISPRYAHRDPTDSSQEARDSLALRLDVSRRLSNKFRLRLRSNYIDQSREDSPQDDRAVFLADFSLVWSPAGGTRLAGG